MAMRKYRVKLVAWGLALVAVGCSTLFATRIGDIKGNPREYDGKTVTVAGKVTASVSVFGVRYFKVDNVSAWLHHYW